MFSCLCMVIRRKHHAHQLATFHVTLSERDQGSGERVQTLSCKSPSVGLHCVQCAGLFPKPLLRPSVPKDITKIFLIYANRL